MDGSALPFEGFFMRESLWRTVENTTPHHGVERAEIKEVIGDSLVDETIDLHTELSTLHEIWISNEISKENESDTLPEPPFLRQNLEKQITLLVELLQQKLSKNSGGKGEVASLPVTLSEEERNIIKTVSRCRSRDADEDDDNAVRPSSHRRPRTALPREDISVSQIDELFIELRQCFRDEREQLLEDITKMQCALMCSSNKRELSKQRRASASIKKLQHLNNKLEREVTQCSGGEAAGAVGARKTTTTINNNVSWSNNFQKVNNKLSPSPPSSGSSKSSYVRPSLVVQSAAKRSGVMDATSILSVP